MKNHIYLQGILLVILFINGLNLKATPVNPEISIPDSFMAKVSAALPPERITICHNQLPYTWNGITCLNAGTYTAVVTNPDGTTRTAVLHLEVIDVGTSITNAVICTNQLPYSWNGHSYTQSGTYSATLTSASGCDSVPILSLTVNDVVSSTTTKSVCTSSLPYVWNGNSYTTSGTYTSVLTSTANCDSIATLHLQVKPEMESITTRNICQAQLPYRWNGHSYTAAGNYSVMLTAQNGCDSLAKLQLSVSPSLSGTTTITICNNELPYSWNGNNYSTAGTYPVTLRATSGCDSIATLILTVKPVLNSLTTVTLCTAQLPYSWNGNTYTSGGTYSVTLPGSSGCDSLARLRLNVSDVLRTTSERRICISELPYIWNGVSLLTAGTYNQSFFTTGGCDSISVLDLVIDLPSTATDSVTICPEELPYHYHGHTFTAAGQYPIFPPVSLDACRSISSLNLIVKPVIPGFNNASVCSNQLPYMWNGNAYTAAGTYSVTLTSSGGCDSLVTLNLAVNSAGTSTTNVEVCSNELPYGWNGNNLTASGTYTHTTTTSSGCDSVATLILTVKPVGSSTTNLYLCTSQLPYSWNGRQLTAAGTYEEVITTSTGCDSMAVLNLRVDDVLASNTDIIICNNQLPYQWNGQTYTSAGTYSVNLSGSSGCDSIAVLSLTVNSNLSGTTDINICNNQLPFTWNGEVYTGAGTYTTTLLSTEGCDSIATLNLTVNETVRSTTTATVCNNQLPYAWNGNSFPVAGSYEVTLTSSGGCDSIVTLNLVVTDVLTSTTNVNICTSQLPYVWNGNSYPAEGTYAVTLTTLSGCDSVPVLSLTIAPYVTSDTYLTLCENELPLSWNNQSITAAGIFTAQLPGAFGCDSVATLHLSVMPVGASTTNISICNGELPFHWNGLNLTSAGTYTATLNGAGGCDSIATLNLLVNPVSSSFTSVNVCSVDLPYLWNGQSYTSPGTYRVNLTGSAGCDSIASLELIVSTETFTSVSQQLCNSELPFLWNGQQINSAGIYTTTLTNSAGCDSVVTLNLSVTPLLSSTIYDTICENALPFTWNIQQLTSGGTYTSSFQSHTGCDSSVTLHLVVAPQSQTIVRLSTCVSQLPFQWNGGTYNASGTYPVTLTSSMGCDSVVTLELTVGQVATSTTEITICAGSLPYSWNGNNYTSPGTYTVSLNGSADCDSVATLVLTVNSASLSNSAISVCSNQLPYSWNGNSYSAPGTYEVNLVNAAGCDSLAVLSLNVSDVLQTQVNTSICTSQLPYTWNNQTLSAAGTYSATLQSHHGCDSVVTLNLTVNQHVSSTTNINKCSNQLPYSWNGLSLNAAGSYSVNLTSQSGCDSIATLQLIVNEPTSSITTEIICSSQLPFSWNGINYSSAGTYSTRLIGYTGCDSLATLILEVNSSPEAPVVQTPVSYCQFEVTQPLQATTTEPGSHLIWYSTPSGSDGSLIAPVPSSSTTGNTNYYVALQNNGCIGPRALITVSVKGTPQLGPDRQMDICFGETANLGNLYSTGEFIYGWTYEDSTLHDVSSVSQEGMYILVATNNTGCSDTARVTLGIQDPVYANAGEDANVEPNIPYQLHGSGNGTFQWSHPNLLNNNRIPGPKVTTDHDVTLVLRVSDTIGCMAYDTIQLRVLNGPTFYVPSAFTPNGDGLNDIFRPSSVGIQKLEFFRVFNRYGELVYETSEIGKGWDGVYKGIRQNTANFVWSIKGTDRFGKVRTMKGNVVLIR